MAGERAVRIGKWYFKLGFIPLYDASHMFLLHFGIFKVVPDPNREPGTDLNNKDIKGFWWMKKLIIKGFELSIPHDEFKPLEVHIEEDTEEKQKPE